MAAVKIAGVALNADAGLEWRLTPGVAPYITQVEIHKARALEIYAKARGEPVVLQIGEATYQGVWVTALLPGKTEEYRVLELRDFRWLWASKTLVRSFNVRQQTTDRFLAGVDPAQFKGPGAVASPLAVAPNLPDVRYMPYSLNGQAPWSFEDALGNLLDATGVVWTRGTATIPTVELEDEEYDTSLDQAIAYLLAYSPTVDIYPTPKATIAIKNVLDGTEAAQLSTAGQPIWGLGSIKTGDYANIRPAAVDVYFDVKQELRFDYDHRAYMAKVQPDEERGKEPRQLIPCIENPLTQLEIDGKKLASGSVVEYRKWLAACEKLNQIPKQPGDPLRDFDDYAVRRCVLSLHEFAHHFIREHDFLLARRIWSDIVQATKHDFRRLFRIRKEWFDRILRYWPTRVSVVDYENLAFARAQAWCSYSKELTEMGGYNRGLGGVNTGEAFPFDGGLLGNTPPAPAEITIPQGGADTGLVRVYLKREAQEETEKIYPGIPDSFSGVVDDGTISDFIYTRNKTTLLEDWHLSVVLTVQRASPNNNGRLHKVTVNPQDVTPLLGQEPGPAFGPRWSIRITPSPTTVAKYIWSDEYAAAIEQSFLEGTPMPAALLLNGADLQLIARAAAARLYAILQNRPVGQAQYTQKTGVSLSPTGAIGAVVQRQNPDGTVTTGLELPRVMQGPDFFSYLPQKVRKRLRGLVQ